MSALSDKEVGGSDVHCLSPHRGGGTDFDEPFSSIG
jgi:hypothetical protein